MPEVRPIDANALLKDKVSNAYISRFEIENAPTLDYEPVVHAHWIEDDDCQICSNCGEEHCWAEYRASYCEDCGDWWCTVDNKKPLTRPFQSWGYVYEID